MKAQFAGRCACCSELFSEGADIQYSEEHGGWTLEEHLKLAPDPNRGKVCPRCFIEIPVSGVHSCDEF